MPSRPSKKAKVQTGPKQGLLKDAAQADKASQQRHLDKTTKAILGKFQGRKSI